ncbi:YbjN domain-containing protein [Pleurocapsales cyanobacterium LEGE 10410]|nr:YbjN domain-containing protein [Pleurocapsales cyanobacterium LEGE 10410]
MKDPIGNFFQHQLTSERKSFGYPATATANNSLRDSVIEFLRQENWQYTITENPSILRMSCQGENGQWRCYAQIKEAERQFIFYSVCPVQTPGSKLGAIAEYTTRANYGMATGNFELDFSDGEVRYKTSICIYNGRLALEAIAHLVSVNVSMMDRYLPGIITVIERDIEPKEAIKTIESV